MKKPIFIFICLIFFAAGVKNEIVSARIRLFENNNSNILPKPFIQQASKKKAPKWVAGNYKGLRLGKSTIKDVRRMFGEPTAVIHPEDAYDNPIESQLDYVYENEGQFIFDKKSGILREVWAGDFSTFEEALSKYGKDFYEVKFTGKGCIFKEYREKQDRRYPLTIGYPQYGFYFHLNDKKEVLAIYYLDKC